MFNRVLLYLLLPYIGWLIFAYEYHFLDGVNLALHEFGHLVFGVAGGVAEYLGGIVVQLGMPIAFASSFSRHGKTFEASVCMIWFAESMLNTALYVGDARDPVLAAEGHARDWHWLLQQWGMLDQNVLIANNMRFLASVLLVLAWIWAWSALSAKKKKVRAV